MSTPKNDNGAAVGLHAFVRLFAIVREDDEGFEFVEHDLLWEDAWRKYCAYRSLDLDGVRWALTEPSIGEKEFTVGARLSLAVIDDDGIFGKCRRYLPNDRITQPHEK